MRREIELIIIMINHLEDLENYRIKDSIVAFLDLTQGIYEELDKLNDSFITQEELEKLKKTNYFEISKMDGIYSAHTDGYSLKFARKWIELYVDNEPVKQK